MGFNFHAKGIYNPIHNKNVNHANTNFTLRKYYFNCLIYIACLVKTRFPEILCIIIGSLMKINLQIKCHKKNNTLP